jgi:hypothetical protein
MRILTTASVAIITGLMMMSAASIPARAAVTGSGSINAEVASANSSDRSPDPNHSWLEPSAANARPKSTNCKPGRIFSQHDVVGDPESCVMQGAGYTLGSDAFATAPAL